MNVPCCLLACYEAPECALWKVMLLIFVWVKVYEPTGRRTHLVCACGVSMNNWLTYCKDSVNIFSSRVFPENSPVGTVFSKQHAAIPLFSLQKTCDAAIRDHNERWLLKIPKPHGFLVKCVLEFRKERGSLV